MGVVGDDLGGQLGARVRAGGHHGGLQEDALEHDVLVREALEDLGPGIGGDLEGGVDVVLAVEQDLGLDDGDEAVLLADGGVAGEAVGAVEEGLVGGARGDVHHGAPLGEAGALLVVLGAALGEPVQALAPGLAVAVGHGHEALVDLDPGDDALLVQGVDEGGAVGAALVERLLEEDGPADVLPEPGVLRRSSRYSRRLDSVFSTPIESRRFPQVPLDSSMARMPLPDVAMALAVVTSSSSKGPARQITAAAARRPAAPP